MMAFPRFLTCAPRLLVAPMAALLALAGCGGGDDRDRLRVTVVGDGDAAERLVAGAARATLISRDGTGALVPGLASSWRFLDDSGSLILRLRPARWPGGRELVTADVLAGLRRKVMRPLRLAAGLSASAAVRAPTARVLELTPAAASPALLDWLAEPGLAITDRRGAPFPGPYAMASSEGITALRRRSDVPSPDALPAAIMVTPMGDAAAAAAAFARAESDVVIGAGLTGLFAARGVGQGGALRLESPRGLYGYAVTARRGPLADPDVRRALAMAIDRSVLADRFGIALLQPADRLLPGVAGDWRGLLLADRQETARQLIAARTESGGMMTVRLLLPPGLEHRQIAEGVAADWEALGVRLIVAQGDGAARSKALTGQVHDLVVTDLTSAVDDPAARLLPWRCRSGGACVPAADRLLAQALAATTPATRAALLAQAEAAYMDAPPVLPLLTPLRWALVARDVRGWTPNAAGVHPLGRLSRRPPG